MKYKTAAKRSKKNSAFIKDRTMTSRWKAREEKASRKGKPFKKPPNRWTSKSGPCDTWIKSRGKIHVPLPKCKRKLHRDGAEYVTNSVRKSEGVFRYHKLGIYLEGNYLSEKLVTKLRPAYNKAARYFRPYMGYGKFAFAVRCCVHFGFTTKRIRDLLRMGDLLRRAVRPDIVRKHFSKWIRVNFSKEERHKVTMDFNVTIHETVNPDLPLFGSDTSSEDNFESTMSFESFYRAFVPK